MYSDTSVTGVVSDVTVHWPGLACWLDFPISAGSSGRSLEHCFSGQFDVTGIPGGLRIRFGRIWLNPASVTTLLLLMDYVDLIPIGLWPRCFFCSGSLAGTVVWLLFIRQYIFALLLMVLLADSRGIPLTTVSCWAPPRNMRGLAHVSYVLPGWDGVLNISLVYGWWTSFRNYLVTGSLLFAAPVWSEIVLCLPRVLTEFLRWTVVDTSWRKSDIWWMCSMASGTDRTCVDVCPAARGCSSEGHVHTEQSLYSSSNSG